MENIVIIIHALVALAIIGLILLQQGKGAEAGASFGGGASQTIFGSQGGGNFFAKVTAVLAAVFFITSFSLAIIAKNNAAVSVADSAVPVVEEGQASDVPVIDSDVPAAPANDVPVVTPEEAASEGVDVPAVNQQ